MTKGVKNLIFLFLAVFFLLSFASPVFAQNFEIDYPEVLGFTPGSTLGEYVRYIFNFAVMAAGVILLGALILGGIAYITSAGDPSKLKDARNRIAGAFLGVILLLSSYLILYTIDPSLVEFIIPPVDIVPDFAWPTPLDPSEEDISLISLEVPYGQALEGKLWAVEKRQDLKSLIEENDEFLRDDIEVENNNFNRISDLNQYFKKLIAECNCGDLRGSCIEAPSGGGGVDCIGDPCQDNRDEMDKILEINEEKQAKLLDFQEIILEEKKVFEDNLHRFIDAEQEILACQQQTGNFTTLNQHLELYDNYRARNQELEIIKIPETEELETDDLTFYCAAGGTVFDYPYHLDDVSIRDMFLLEELLDAGTPAEMTVTTEISCEIEFPLGIIVDQIRELTILLIIKMERLAELQEGMSLEIRDMNELSAQCNDDDCKTNCGQLPNPCYYPPMRGAPVCWPFQQSQALQAPGGCEGEPCPPLEDFEKIVNNLKKLEEEAIKTIREIKQISDRVSLLLEGGENETLSLQSIKTGIGLCHGSDWSLFNCDSVIGTLGPGGQIIGDCQPRSFFCCSETGASFGEGLPEMTPDPAHFAPQEEFEPIEKDKFCDPDEGGWLCKEEIEKYDQYDDASEPIKGLLSCMRQELDKMQVERELDSKVGEIAVITDRNLYSPGKTCDWIGGPIDSDGCTYTYENSYGKERVSPHYGGVFCRLERKSYAVAFSDTENSEYIIEAAKKCRADAYISSRVPGHYQYLHVSLAQAYGCGAN